MRGFHCPLSFSSHSALILSIFRTLPSNHIEKIPQLFSPVDVYALSVVVRHINKPKFSFLARKSENKEENKFSWVPVFGVFLIVGSNKLWQTLICYFRCVSDISFINGTSQTLRYIRIIIVKEKIFDWNVPTVKFLLEWQIAPQKEAYIEAPISRRCGRKVWWLVNCDKVKLMKHILSTFIGKFSWQKSMAICKSLSVIFSMKKIHSS